MFLEDFLSGYGESRSWFAASFASVHDPQSILNFASHVLAESQLVLSSSMQVSLEIHLEKESEIFS